eukprot:Plantae.Rhodophyta-Hildenbrandia_rubra.ctg306.p3 GENE.Plantae.Rhodophyta-Hildenbrandia_rubra.ctg306~~Plantae.Rhodophyta-Hildenbrandia_rubra.ctg306.p3  ORF type:complete len:301 (-),score=61.36 Plantae.Rhodophyta-Hildenbrandia_rubra.ctg306:4021-4812(-)
MPTFFAYLQGGLHLHFTVAVDFTRSNKEPHDPASLHHMDQMGSNMYTQAISAVGNVIAPYSPDNRFVALGFGASLPPQNQVSHKFSMSAHADPHVSGVQGILQAYQKCLSSVQLSGPTHFTPIISHVMQLCRNRQQIGQNLQDYDVLLILTDGIVNDMSSTIDAIIEASSLPMSIIIVGIGNKEDWGKMHLLDGDNEDLVSSDGRRKGERDIVQFVEYSKFAHRTPDRLAAKLLEELPGNVVDFFFDRNVRPNPPQMPIQPQY